MSRLAQWVEFQCKTYDVESSAVAASITIERVTGERVGEWPISMGKEALTAELEQMMEMQRQELPRGSYTYKLVAYDEKRAQLSELPQTIRGANTDAATGSIDRISDQRAVHQMLTNYQQASDYALQAASQLSTQLGEERENCNLLLEKLREASNSNLEASMSMMKLTKRFEREDQIIEAVMPAVGALLQAAVESKGKDWIEKLLAPSPAKADTQNAKTESNEPAGSNADAGNADGQSPSGSIVRATGNDETPGSKLESPVREGPKRRNAGNGRSNTRGTGPS
jgi:hypothetical protein